jgi:hypothetical protein
MVKEIVGQVVADVPEDTTTEDRSAHVPVPVKDLVRQLPEWSGQHNEKGRRHDQSELIHRKVVMNTVKEEMESQGCSVVWEEAVGC